jgi:hypothetical protein
MSSLSLHESSINNISVRYLQGRQRLRQQLFYQALSLVNDVFDQAQIIAAIRIPNNAHDRALIIDTLLKRRYVLGKQTATKND